MKYATLIPVLFAAAVAQENLDTLCIEEGRIGSALLDRFREPLIAADNTT